MTRRIQCITKLPNHQDRHRRIQAVGGSWGKDSEETAIANVKRDASAYDVTEQGKTVKVIVRKHDGRDYLKTENDRFLPDNLLSLPECR
jgi:Protein of unknown function (DUF3892)